MQHDAFSCDGFEGAQPFPVASDPQGFHVGQVFDEHDQGRLNDVQALRAATQPVRCVVGGRGHPRREPRDPSAIVAECVEMQRTYGVRPGVTWGTLRRRKQVLWSRLSCDARV